MNKVKLVGAVAGVASLLAFATPAFAATISNPLFSNGQTTIDANGGATVSGTFTLTVGPGEVVEWLRTQSDPSQPFVDTSVGGQLGYQEQVYTNVPFSVKVPPNTGTVYPTVQGAGIYGGNRAINGGDSVVLGPVNLGTVRVVANTVSSDPVPTGSTSEFAQLMAMLNAILHPSTPAVPADPICAEFKADINGLSQGTQDPAGTLGRAGTLQSFLMSKGFDIPLLRENKAPYGYYGSQTASAVLNFRNAHQGCN